VKNVVILGSTGSIGSQVVDVCEKHPDSFHVIGLAAHKNATTILQQIRRLTPKYVCLYDEAAANEVLRRLDMQRAAVLHGLRGLQALASLPEADVIVIGMPGAIGLRPTLAAVRANKTVVNANKESIVIAGHIIMQEVRDRNLTFLPLDGEHLAIYQCLKNEDIASVKRIILTASGGPFRDVKTINALQRVTCTEALKHPTWSMGPKISVDSATLMNKGLEVIEAHHLFNMPYDMIDVVIHRESIVHGLVELRDGSVLAQLSVNDMRLAALYALSYPIRAHSKDDFLDLPATRRLTFEPPPRGSISLFETGTPGWYSRRSNAHSTQCSQ